MNELDARELHYDVTLPATPVSVAKARHALARFGERHHADPEKIALGVSEAVSNAVLHAYRDDLSNHPVEIEAHVEDAAVVVAVTDRGVGMGTNMKSPGLHFGLSLMSAVADRVSIGSDQAGVRVEMAFTRFV